MTLEIPVVAWDRSNNASFKIRCMINLIHKVNILVIS
jgi:hypothetical protein